MTLQEGMLQFNFIDVKSVFKFDEENRISPNFHGLSHCMKAVDFIAEYVDHYIFMEIKDPSDPTRYGTEHDITELIKDLVTKFRDTFIYRWAETKLNKPVYFLCLIELDNTQTLTIMDQLKIKLPMAKKPSRWQRPLAQVCAVANLETWNKIFPNIQVTRVTGSAP